LIIVGRTVCRQVIVARTGANYVIVASPQLIADTTTVNRVQEPQHVRNPLRIKLLSMQHIMNNVNI
jgi:hypothetical protein